MFNHCYVSNSICAPSRATILTGMHNHNNLVHTLGSKIDRRMPNVAKQLRTHGGYQTAMIGKWHLGEGKEHEPCGFDHWDVLPGQGTYFDPKFITPEGTKMEPGYATDLITDKTLNFLDNRDKDKPFFVMCHHKAPHRSWEPHPKHRDLYLDPIKVPETYDDDYKNRAKAVLNFTNRVRVDLTWTDLGLVQPEGGEELAGELMGNGPAWKGEGTRKIPHPKDVTKMKPIIDRETGEKFTFKTQHELAQFKYQRYMRRYLQTVQSIDDNVGRILDYLEQNGLSDNTVVCYTSDQGFFLG